MRAASLAAKNACRSKRKTAIAAKDRRAESREGETAAREENRWVRAPSLFPQSCAMLPNGKLFYVGSPGLLMRSTK